MGCIRPATPGFLVTLVATALLAVVSFCVPFFKSVYFLKATITVENVSGNITFGTLGYCLELSNGTTCSKPSIGYELDINSLVGNRLPIEIPQVAVKWITYALFTHVVALILSAGSAVFGLLAHVREMSMTCLSTCISGFAAGIALIAFIFDLVLFFVAKARISAIGSASIGNAIWLTLAAWILLFFSGCFYTLGRCCVQRRPKTSGKGLGEGGTSDQGYPNRDHAEQMRLDAVKADVDRKARERQQKEVGLPAFSETQPLTARVEGDHVYLDGEDDHKSAAGGSLASKLSHPTSLNSNGPQYASGYAQGPVGSRAVDEYYNTTHDPSGPAMTYPPQSPHRQASAHAYPPTGYANTAGYAASPQRQASGYGSPPQRQPSGYAPSSTPYAQIGYGAYQTASPPPMPTQTLAVPGQPPYADPYDPYGGQQSGHTAGGSSYHTAASHNQQPSAYSQYDPYGQTSTSPPPPQQSYYSPQPHVAYSEPPQAAFLVASSSDPYNPPQRSNTQQYTGYGAAAATTTSPPPSSSNHTVSTAYYQPPQQQQQQQQRQYTLGGEAYADGYGANSVPPLPEPNPYGGYAGQQQQQQPATLLDTSTGAYGTAPMSPVRGPRAQPGTTGILDDAPPPQYEQGNTGVTGNWGKR